METIKVNMNPNPLDVQTIHASQNDGEARQWGFELHNNGDAIDSSEITDQMVFKAYKGGTEQILPENTSVPTTSPIIADIQYKDALRSEQEFLYRESPTTVDGKAKITKIKGNTLVWNQLIQNGNFVDGTNNWKASGSSTISASNGELTVTIGAAWNNDARQNRSLVAGHKYLGIFKAKSDTLRNIGVSLGQYGAVANVRFARTETLSSTYQTVVGIATITESTSVIRCSLLTNASSYVGQTYTIKDVMLFDLTQMGLDISNPSDFTSLFPLSYYAYNQGTLLSFMGNGIKTVGFNQWDEEWEHGSLGNNGENTGSSASPEIRSTNYIPIVQNASYYLNVPAVAIVHYYGSADLSNYKGNQYIASAQLLNIPNGTNYIRFRTIGPYGDYKNDICLNISDPNRNGTYEPYTSSTLSLPTSTYFPTGMKSGGPTYDEMTNSKYVIRTKYIKFDGSQAWTTRTTSGGSVLYEFVPPDIKNVGTQATAQISNNIYPWNTNLSENKTIRQVNTTISVRRDDITSLQAWYSELANNPLEVVYQLATPTETSFTTASLVTENAEIPLSNEDGVLIGKCTEELSAEPGFHDAKIKLSDADGECYSNKLQLHIERSPQ